MLLLTQHQQQGATSLTLCKKYFATIGCNTMPWTASSLSSIYKPITKEKLVFGDAACKELYCFK
jgi:hypothetical protein